MGKSPSCLIFICKFRAWFTGPAMSRWDGGGCDDLVHSAGGGSAALRCRRSGVRPGHHHETLCDLGKDHDPSEDTNAVALRFTVKLNAQLSSTQLAVDLPAALAHLRNSTRSDGTSATALPNGFKKRKRALDNNPQLKGRMTLLIVQYLDQPVDGR
jgi:hypothetical protein